MNNKQSKKFRQMYRSQIDNIAGSDLFNETKKSFRRISRQRDICFIIGVVGWIAAVLILIFWR